MNPLTDNNIESELSYAYLHAVAAHAGVGCKVSSRHDDNAGVDAELTGWGPFSSGGYLQEVDIKVQLKATIKPPQDDGNCLSYSLSGIKRYDDLRAKTILVPRILVVLFLPTKKKDWLSCTEESLILRKCAYWVSLRGAESSGNSTAQTIYLPKMQKFDTAGLSSLMSQLSNSPVLPTYKGKL